MTDALTSGVLSESWTTTNATYSPATFSGVFVEAWISQNEALVIYADVTGTLIETWHTAPTGITVAYTSGLLLEAWAAQAIDENVQIASGVLVEVWLVIGVDPPPDPTPEPIYCAADPQDATGDPGSPGTGMTDMLGGAFVADNAPVDSTGDIPTDPTPITFLFGGETLTCVTTPANATGDAGSTGTGMTSQLVGAIVPDVTPTNATGDVYTANSGVSVQLGSSISCTTSPTSGGAVSEGSLLAFGAITGSPLAGDAGDESASGVGVTDQFGDALTCANTPTDASGGTGPLPSAYTSQI